MNDEQIAAAIINILMQNGYGKTAAENSVSPITEIIFLAAYEMGQNSK